MLKQYKKALILSSLLILLPIPAGLVLQKVYSGQMYIPIAPDYNSVGLPPTMLYFPSLTLLLLQWIAVYFTAKDPGNKNRNRKPFLLVIWMMPVISLVTYGLMFALALGCEVSPSGITLLLLGLMFAVIGNYLPKCKMNSTIGIKIPWAYTSHENWNATHRFGGKVWMVGGIVMSLCAFLPEKAAVFAMVAEIPLLIIIPVAYSCIYYRKQKERGEELKALSLVGRRFAKAEIAVIVLILLFLGMILFAGNLEYEFGDKYLTIKASLYNDMGIDYAGIQSVEYREGNVPGMRVGGYGSFRLLMGYFQNEEFGTHIRYTYYKPESCIVLSWRDKTVVLSGENAAETQEIYQKLLEVTN